MAKQKLIFGFSEERREPPVTKNEILYNKLITGTGNGGTGLFKIESFVVFVNDTTEGERYDVRINNVINTCAFAEIVHE